MSISSVKIQFSLNEEHLKALAYNATKLFFRAGLAVDEDTVFATRSEGANCVNIEARPRNAHASIDLRSFHNILELFNPLDHAYYEKTTGKVHLMCVEISRLGAQTEAI